MRLLLLTIILLLNFNSFSQEIKWTTITKNEYNPTELISRGVVTLDNGDKTPEADLYINFDTQRIFYKNVVSKETENKTGSEQLQKNDKVYINLRALDKITAKTSNIRLAKNSWAEPPDGAS